LDDDADALAAYIRSLTPKSPPPPPAHLLPVIRRGKEIFFSKKAGCSACHPPPLYTDSGRRNAAGEFRLHDVGTWTAGEDESLRRLDTPSLLGLRQTEPYLHDGRAPTLEAVFTRCNPEDRHGKTSHLSLEEVRSLAAFLRFLAPPPADRRRSAVE
jgi:cytochrome c peroxidase